MVTTDTVDKESSKNIVLPNTGDTSKTIIVLIGGILASGALILFKK
ncbi:LPXTG cell wall anchor domain-containing protein [Listeria monocytogenes]|nr:LPXTG cell wall anchor domain-containing protein [Listeria monocytogenes]